MTEKKLVIRGVEWRYATGGRGRETVLLFHGAVGGAETMRSLAAALGDEYRTVAPTIADVRTLDEVCDAVSVILDREHVGRAHVFGGSFGGMVAQAFLRRRWRQVENLILLGTALPDPLAGARTERTMRMMRLLPFRLTRALLKAEIRKQLSAPAPPDVAGRVSQLRERLADYFDNRLTKETLLARVALGVDFNRNEVYNSDGHAEWAGRALIVESGDDPAVTPEERRRLREAYPRAMVCTFTGSGDMIPLLRLEELAEVVRAFLKEDYKSPADIESCPADEWHDDRESVAHARESGE
jgi:pimeloyl-ACP methyl ester carboxylesterase